MSKWFCATTYMPKLREVEVDRVTGKFVVVNGIRRARETDAESYFENEDAAIEWLIQRATEKRDSAKENLERYEKALNDRLAMRKPT